MYTYNTYMFIYICIHIAMRIFIRGPATRHGSAIVTLISH